MLSTADCDLGAKQRDDVSEETEENGEDMLPIIGQYERLKTKCCVFKEKSGVLRPHGNGYY